MRLNVVKEAAYDYFYLLRRGYPKGEALRLVSCRYMLSDHERIVLQRCVHPPDLSLEIRSKTLSVPSSCLYVDGYNQVATIYAAIQGLPVFRCLDGLTRDVLRGKINRARALMIVTPLLRDYLERVSGFAKCVIILLDSQVPRSGIHASMLRALFRECRDLKVYVATSRRVDSSLIMASMRRGCAVASSDILVAQKSRLVFDLAGQVIKCAGLKAISIFDLIYEVHDEWCRGPVAQPG